MNRRSFHPIPALGALAVLAALSGCVSDSGGTQAGGGFETSDLQARITDSAGTPVEGAAIWLVRGDLDPYTPSTALDSALSDSQGIAAFPESLAALSRTGLEAWLGDTLVGLLERVDTTGAEQIVVLRRTRALYLPCSTYASASFVLMGTHRAQTAPATCVDSFAVAVPPSDFWLAIVPDSASGLEPERLRIQGGDLPAWRHEELGEEAAGGDPSDSSTTGSP